MATRKREAEPVPFRKREDEGGREVIDRPFSPAEAVAQDEENRRLLEETRGIAASRSKRP